MSIALTAEHEALREVAARWLAGHSPREVVRAAIEGSEDPVTPGPEHDPAAEAELLEGTKHRARGGRSSSIGISPTHVAGAGERRRLRDPDQARHHHGSRVGQAVSSA